MFNFFRKLFGKNVKDQEKFLPVLDERGESIDDPMLSEVLNRAWQTGKPVVAHSNGDGTFEVKEIE